MGQIRIMEAHTVVAGSGAAGFNAADRLRQYGVEDVVLVTENINAGTSRNTGSDKQTYYKLSLAGGQRDSVRRLAEVLFEGGCVDGDHALCEAALSCQGFFKLVELGVPFPHNRYGEFVGYKTDHDPNDRGTSVGPYTSRYMTEALEGAVREKKIPIYDNFQVIRILTKDNKVYGILCLDKHLGGYVVVKCTNLVYATGGPAGIYRDSVYPQSQLGASGIAFEAGGLGKNLTEWQYGLASLKPRWNVSGSYMQVLPRFVSTDPEGGDEREFLMEFYGTREEMMDKIFLKGYQWPFDARKVSGGSSMIDLLVYRETCVRGRRVWLDYRQNPGGRTVDFKALSRETKEYLERAGACQDTPYERLCQLNGPAAAFYLEHGVDLSKDLLEVAVCAQHNNGGLAVNEWWQTNVEGFFAVGEAAGTHGIYRPGGSALNAGQVGSTRAARFIAAHKDTLRTWNEETEKEIMDKARQWIAMGEKAWVRQRVTEKAGTACQDRQMVESAEGHCREAKQDRQMVGSPEEDYGKACQDRQPAGSTEEGYREANVEESERSPGSLWKKAAGQMSRYGAMLRSLKGMEQMRLEIERELKELMGEGREAGRGAPKGYEEREGNRSDMSPEENPGRTDRLSMFYRYLDMRICQKVYLDAMIDYVNHGGKSRGSAVYLEEPGTCGQIQIPELAVFSLDGPDGRAHEGEVQEISYVAGDCKTEAVWRRVRPLDEILENQAFEVVWKSYREGDIYR